MLCIGTVSCSRTWSSDSSTAAAAGTHLAATTRYPSSSELRTTSNILTPTARTWYLPTPELVRAVLICVLRNHHSGNKLDNCCSLRNCSLINLPSYSSLCYCNLSSLDFFLRLHAAALGCLHAAAYLPSCCNRHSSICTSVNLANHCHTQATYRTLSASATSLSHSTLSAIRKGGKSKRSQIATFSQRTPSVPTATRTQLRILFASVVSLTQAQTPIDATGSSIALWHTWCLVQDSCR